MIHFRLLLIAVCAALLAACGTPKITPVARGTVSVKVVPDFNKKAPVHIEVYAPKDGKRGPPLNAYVVGADGITGFVLPVDKVYEFRAFADLNKNGKADPNEPAGILEGVKPNPDLSATQEPVVLTLSAGTPMAEEPAKAAAPDAPGGAVSPKGKGAGKKGKAMPKP